MIPLRRASAPAALLFCLAVGAAACTEAPDSGAGAESGGEVPAGGADSAQSAPLPRMAAPLVATVLGCEREADSLRTTGSSRNQGQEDVRYIDLTLSWADSTGTLVATDVASIVGGETLMAGDSVVFDVATAHPQASECVEASVFFYEPIP